jgi:hypothetical protein
MITLLDLPQDNPSVQRILHTKNCRVHRDTVLTPKFVCDYIYHLQDRQPPHRQIPIVIDLKVILKMILEKETKKETVIRKKWCCFFSDAVV